MALFVDVARGGAGVAARRAWLEPFFATDRFTEYIGRGLLAEHALWQGDGEISGTAIEASLDVTFQLFLRRDFQFPSPLLRTPDSWMTHGFDEDLDLAMRGASLGMLGLLTEHYGLTRDDAYSLMSVATDFAVTQVVDGRQGVHARICTAVFPPDAPA